MPRVQAWLAREFGGEAGDYRFERDARGRPHLQRAALDCSWSHSGEALLLALGEDVELGVDIERLRPRPRAMELARRFYHPDETAWLQSLDDDARVLAFVRLWCAKEAVLKAHGHGISFGLHRFRLADGEGGLRIVECDPRLGDPAAWRLHEFRPVEGYLGAIAWHPLD